MNCEVCGSPIIGKPANVVIEGAKLSVCQKCSHLGKPYWEPVAPSRQARRTIPRTKSTVPLKPKPRTDVLPKEVSQLELAEDFAERIRKARMKLNMTQELLAKNLNERLSVIQKIETKKIVPDTRLSKLLEHTLKIKLLIPASETPEKTADVKQDRELTLGDIVQIKNREKTP